MLPGGRLKQEALLLRQRIHRRRGDVDTKARQLTADLHESLRSPFALPAAFAIGLVVPRLHPWALVAPATRLAAKGMAVMRIYRLFHRGFAMAVSRAQ